MEEGAILRVIKVAVQLLFPNNASVVPQVDDAKVERVLGANKGQSTNDAGVGPLVRVRVSNVQSSDSSSDDFLASRLGQDPLDLGPVIRVEGDARHGEGGC